MYFFNLGMKGLMHVWAFKNVYHLSEYHPHPGNSVMHECLALQKKTLLKQNNINKSRSRDWVF